MFCFKCGFEIKDGYKFCPKCGAPAYVEKEESQSEVEAQVEDAKVNAEKEEFVAKADDGAETTSDCKTASSSTNNVYVPNPFMAIELDIEDVKRGAEKGNKEAMSLQCFRYEMGIGTEIDMEKYNELKELGASSFGKEWISLFYYSKELAIPYLVTKNE